MKYRVVVTPRLLLNLYSTVISQGRRKLFLGDQAMLMMV